MKKLLNIFPILLIILGSALEIYFYIFRFTQDGINIYLSIIIGIALTLFLSLLMLRREKLSTWFLIIPLALYSIMATSAGQSFSLSVLHNEEIRSEVQEINRQQQIDEYLSDISRLNNDLDQLSKQITAKTTWERNKYNEAIEAVQIRQDEIKTEKALLQEKINELRSQQTITETTKKESTNIYKFYNNLFGFNVSFLQFFLQTILSFFIAAMSPLAIIILSSAKKQSEIKPKTRKKNVNQNTIKPEIRKQQPDYSKYVDRWVSVSWTRFRNNPEHNKSIVPKDAVIKYINNLYSNGKEKIFFTDKIYDKIFSAAIDIKVIDKKGIINNNVNEQQVKDLLNKYLKGGK